MLVKLVGGALDGESREVNLDRNSHGDVLRFLKPSDLKGADFDPDDFIEATTSSVGFHPYKLIQIDDAYQLEAV